MIHLGCYFYYHAELTQLIFQDNADLGRTLEQETYLSTGRKIKNKRRKKSNQDCEVEAVVKQGKKLVKMSRCYVCLAQEFYLAKSVIWHPIILTCR